MPHLRTLVPAMEVEPGSEHRQPGPNPVLSGRGLTHLSLKGVEGTGIGPSSRWFPRSQKTFGGEESIYLPVLDNLENIYLHDLHYVHLKKAILFTMLILKIWKQIQ